MPEPISSRRELLSRLLGATKHGTVGPQTTDKPDEGNSTYQIFNPANPTLSRRSLNWLLALVLLKPSSAFADDEETQKYLDELKKYALVDSDLAKAQKLVSDLISKGEKNKTIDIIKKELDKGTPVVCGALHRTSGFYKFLERHAAELKLDVFFEEFPKELNVTFLHADEKRKLNYQEAFDLWMYYAWKDNPKYNSTNNFKIVEKAVKDKWDDNPPRFSRQDIDDETLKWNPSTFKVPREIENKITGWGRHGPEFEIAAFEALIKAGTRVVLMDYRGTKYLDQLVAKKHPILESRINDLSESKIFDPRYEEENDRLMAEDVFKEINTEYYSKEKRKPRILTFIGRAHTTENPGAKYKFNENLIRLLNEKAKMATDESKSVKASDRVCTIEFTTDCAKGAPFNKIMPTPPGEKRIVDRASVYDIASLIYALRDLEKKSTPLLSFDMKNSEIFKLIKTLMKSDTSSASNDYHLEDGYMIMTASPISKVGDTYLPRCDYVHIEAKEAGK